MVALRAYWELDSATASARKLYSRGTNRRIG
jgi:hypothetical protein